MAQYDPYNPARAPSQAKPIVLPHGTTHGTPAMTHVKNLALGLLGSALRGGKKKALSAGLRRRRKATRKASAKPLSRRTRRASGKSGSNAKRSRRSGSSRLVKGSAAAKKRMAALRKMRKVG